MFTHTSVLPEEVMRFLEPKPGGRFIDATLGSGGHTRMLLERTAPDGRVLAIDQDEWISCSQWGMFPVPRKTSNSRGEA